MKYLKYIVNTLALVAFFTVNGFSQCEINIGNVDVNNLEAFEFTASSSSICGVSYKLQGTTNKKIAFVVIALDPAGQGRGNKLVAYRTSNAASGSAKSSSSVALVAGRRYKIVSQLLVE